MKTKNIFLTLFLFCTTLCFAQQQLFEKYGQMEDVSSVYISKAMFQMMPTLETAGLNLINMKGKVESLQILSTESNPRKEEMNKEFSQLISKQHEELMRVKDKDTRATFYVKKKGDMINELIMLVHTNTNFSVFQLLGNFTLQDIQSITQNTTKAK